MGIDTSTAADHGTTDALASIPDDLLGPIPAELRLGANVLLVQEKPAELGDVVTIMARLRIVREGKEKVGTDVDADVRHFRAGKIVAAWIKGDPEPPDPEEDQPGLFDEGGNPIDDDDEGEEPDDGDDTDNVARPNFSDGKK